MTCILEGYDHRTDGRTDHNGAPTRSTSRNRAHDRGSFPSLDRRLVEMIAARPCRYEIVYELPPTVDDDAHEAWIVEWAMDSIDRPCVRECDVTRDGSGGDNWFTITVIARPGRCASSVVQELVTVIEAMGTTIERLEVVPVVEEA